MEKNPEDVVANNTETNNSANANANHSQSEVNQEASTSSAVFNRSKKNVKRRSYRQKNPHSDENDSSSSNIDENNKPGSSTSNLRASEEQPEQQRLQTSKANIKSTSRQPTKRKKRNPPADDSDTYILDSDHETDTETSDDWTTSKEEKYAIPEVLNKVKPKPTLNIIKEIVQRQIGRRVQFEGKFYGSLYMVERLQYLHSLSEHWGCVSSIEFNAKGDLVSGSDDLTVIVWNWATGKKCRSYVSGHRNNIFQASWLPCDDSSMMVTCASDGEVRLLDLNNGRTRKLAAHRGTCNSFTIHPDYPHVAMSVGDDGQVLSVDVRDSETTKLVVPLIKGCPIELFTIHSNPQNSNEFCIGGRSEFVRIYDRRKAHKPIMKLCPKNVLRSDRVYITAVTYNYNGTEVLASYNNDDIYLFDTLLPHPDGDYAHKYEGHLNNKRIKGVNYFGPKSEFIVSGSDCGSIFIWEKNTEAIVQYLPADAQELVNCVKPHPHIPVLASSGWDNDVKIWVPSAADPPSVLSRTGLRTSVLANMRHRRDDEVAYQSRRSNLFYVLLDLFMKSNKRWSVTSSDEDGDDL